MPCGQKRHIGAIVITVLFAVSWRVHLKSICLLDTKNLVKRTAIQSRAQLLKSCLFRTNIVSARTRIRFSNSIANAKEYLAETSTLCYGPRLTLPTTEYQP